MAVDEVLCHTHYISAPQPNEVPFVILLCCCQKEFRVGTSLLV